MEKLKRRKVGERLPRPMAPEQIKGGSVRWPTRDDILRLRQVARHYHAKAGILADWQKGRQPTLYALAKRLGDSFEAKDVWNEVTPEAVFG